MHEKIIDAVKANKEIFLSGLRQIMQIESVEEKPKPEAPFGEGPKQALNQVLLLAENMGFQTGVVNHAVGYAQLGENNQDYIGVLGHLDVVPAGDGWNYPPFDLTLENGNLYGRGILDNKGPIISCLYTLYTLKMLNIPLSKTIRVIFGTNEESGCHDIPLYLEKEHPPMYGFTPDCKYPAVYGERGLIDVTIKTGITDGSHASIEKIEADFTKSSVPDHMKIQFSDGQWKELFGKRSPSNAPELGENVITIFAREAGVFNGQFAYYLNWLEQGFHLKHNGEGLNLEYADEASGKLLLTPYKLEIEDEAVLLSVSMRYPISIKEETILQTLKANLPDNSKIIINRRMPSTQFDLNHPMLSVMKNIYEKCTGMDGTPVTTTGATYARFMPNTIAFGPSFPGQKGIAHNKDEYMSLSDLMKNMEIYALTIYELAK